MSQEACANLLGCSVRAVEGRLYRARTELAALLGGR
jgi:DNA-directed RNA polymerase specialized sigma24 family protein